MQRVIMKSKIHRATVTRAAVDYIGSCGVAPELMHAGALCGDCTPAIVHADATNRIREQAAIA
ncbi:MAG: aspartate 1-decarboxylase [Candidatus Dormiibacterota bacterium]